MDASESILLLGRIREQELAADFLRQSPLPLFHHHVPK
jgi:hypothetical protein